MDIPLQRTIKIGKARIGLLGLDIALNRVLAAEKTEEEAVCELLATVKKNNYIPAGMEDLYKEALGKEYQRLKNHQEITGDSDLVIRILGRPCVTCNTLKTMTIEVLQQLNIAADIIDVQDLDEIWRYGVTKTPALLINDQVICAGIQPSRFQLEEWLKDVLEKRENPLP